MRKLAIALLLLAGMLFLVSCTDDTHFDRATVANTNVQEGLQALDDIQDALAGIGYDVDFAENTISAMLPEDNEDNEDHKDTVDTEGNKDNKEDKDTEDSKTSSFARHKERYAPVPIEMFLLKEDEYAKYDKYANNYYYCYGLVPEWTDSKDTYEYMDFYLVTDYEDNVEYLSVAVIGNDKQEGWSDLKGEFEVYVYFKFAGYSHDLRRPVGYFEFYELI